MKETLIPLSLITIVGTLIINVIMNALMLVNPLAIWVFQSYDYIFGLWNVLVCGGLWWLYSSTYNRFDTLRSFFDNEYHQAFQTHNGLSDPMAELFLSTEPGKFISYHKQRASQIEMDNKPIKALTILSVVTAIMAFLNLGTLIHFDSLNDGSIMAWFAVILGLSAVPVSLMVGFKLNRGIKDLRDMIDWENNLFVDFKKKSKINDPKFDETLSRQEILKYFGVVDVSKIKDLIGKS